MYRVKVTTTFVRAGVPISKLKHFRDLLKENALRLHEPRHMLDLIPFILDSEKSKIKTDIKDKLYVSLIFDGTSRLGEVLAVVFRYIGDDWQICQHLVRLEFLSKSLTGEEVARQLINILWDRVKIPSWGCAGWG